MRKSICGIVLTVVSLVLAQEPSYAKGTEHGNGGGAFVCLGPNNEVLSAQSQDLWEGGNLDLLEYLKGDESSLIAQAIGRLKDTKLFQKQVDRATQEVIQRRKIRNVRIVPVGDDKRDFEMATCPEGRAEFAQAAIYFKSGEVVFSKQIWEKMDSLSRAALTLHEGVYKVFRDQYGERDSIRARKAVSYLLSVDGIEAAPEKVFPKGCASCTTAKLRMLAIPFQGETLPPVSEILSLSESQLIQINSIDWVQYGYAGLKRDTRVGGKDAKRLATDGFTVAYGPERDNAFASDYRLAVSYYFEGTSDRNTAFLVMVGDEVYYYAQNSSNEDFGLMAW